MVFLSFPGSQAKPNWVLRFINCYGKANRETHALAQWHMIGHQLFVSAPIGNVFYLHAAIFEIPMQRFIIKPPACWGTDVSVDSYQLLLLFSIISPCSKAEAKTKSKPEPNSSTPKPIEFRFSWWIWKNGDGKNQPLSQNTYYEWYGCLWSYS